MSQKAVIHFGIGSLCLIFVLVFVQSGLVLTDFIFSSTPTPHTLSSYFKNLQLIMRNEKL